MNWRRTEPGDVDAIKRLWEEAGYGFDFPEVTGNRVVSSWVAIEDGCIVAWAGARIAPEIIAIMDGRWGSPHRRKKLFATLHRPIAEDVRAAGFESAFCNCDPKFPSFARHLKRLGWFEGWKTMWITAGRILGAKT